MKVCHVSTFDGGGAFIAGFRYHEQLLKLGIESSFLIAPKSIHKNIPGLIYDHYHPSMFTKLYNRVNTVGQNFRKLKALKGEYEMFSFPETPYRVEENEHIQKADIIHLHFVSQYINYPTFFKNVRKPILWTLHDMNPLMGGFHYSIDLDRNRPVFSGIENKLAASKKNYTVHKNIHFIALSGWMQNQLQTSPYKEMGHSVLNNGLDLQAYSPVYKENGYTGSSKKKILFVAESLQNHRKGFDLLLEAINNKEIISKSELVALGNLEKSALPAELKIHCPGYIKDEQEKIKIYNSADVVIIPSREDNFPNIMLEAMACGKPVIAFANGGMSDVIDNQTNGLLVEDTSATALREAILKFLNNEIIFDASVIRKYAEEHFCIKKQTEKLISIYKFLP